MSLNTPPSVSCQPKQKQRQIYLKIYKLHLTANRNAVCTHTLEAPQHQGVRVGVRILPGTSNLVGGGPTNVHTYFVATNSNDDTVLVHTFFNYANFRHTHKRTQAQ